MICGLVYCLNLCVLLKQKEARLRAALTEKRRLERQCQDALEELESVHHAGEISSDGEGMPEVAGDCPRTREAVSRVLKANGGTETRGVTGVRSHPKKEADFSGRGSPPGEHTSCYVSTAGSRVGEVSRWRYRQRRRVYRRLAGATRVASSSVRVGRVEQAHTPDYSPCWHSLGLLQIVYSGAATVVYVAEGRVNEAVHACPH